MPVKFTVALTQNLCATDDKQVFELSTAISISSFPQNLNISEVHFWHNCRLYSQTGQCTDIFCYLFVFHFSLWQETSLIQFKTINSHCRRCWICSWGLAISGCSFRRPWGSFLLCRCSNFRPVGSKCLTLCGQVSIQYMVQSNNFSIDHRWHYCCYHKFLLQGVDRLESAEWFLAWNKAVARELLTDVLLITCMCCSICNFYTCRKWQT